MLESRQAVYSSYEEAAEEAGRIKRDEKSGRLVTKVENSPYGEGFVVRTFPVAFLFRQRLRPRNRTLEYRSL